MGYTHYWRRPEVVDYKTMSAIVEDFKKVLPTIDSAGIELAGGDGSGEAIITKEIVKFNGKENCGHAKDDDIGIAWPAKLAGGVGNQFMQDAKVGQWFAGAELSTRVCGGDCSHETFYFPRLLKAERWEKPEGGLYFDFTKTAFKPYDLAVTAFLIIAKKQLGDQIKVSSDGEVEHWIDAAMICQIELGYGADVSIDKEGRINIGRSNEILQ